MVPAYTMCERDHIVLGQETSEFNKRCHQMVKAIGLSNKTREQKTLLLGNMELWDFTSFGFWMTIKELPPPPFQRYGNLEFHQHYTQNDYQRTTPPPPQGMGLGNSPTLDLRLTVKEPLPRDQI